MQYKFLQFHYQPRQKTSFKYILCFIMQIKILQCIICTFKITYCSLNLCPYHFITLMIISDFYIIYTFYPHPALLRPEMPRSRKPFLLLFSHLPMCSYSDYLLHISAVLCFRVPYSNQTHTKEHRHSQTRDEPNSLK